MLECILEIGTDCAKGRLGIQCKYLVNSLVSIEELGSNRDCQGSQKYASRPANVEQYLGSTVGKALGGSKIV